MFKKIMTCLLATFYFFGGLNHFIRPGNYKLMIPPYIPFPSLVNYASGFMEIFLAILILIPATRYFASKIIILMLVLFLPVHIYMLQTGWCIKGYCLPHWLVWVRLIILQPLLIYWAWWVGKKVK